MPELPEVETMRRILEPQLAGAKILSIQINNEKIIAHPGAEDFIKKVQENNHHIHGKKRKVFDIPIR